MIAGDERSAYRVLLMHSKWGPEGECGLLGHCRTAVERLAEIYDSLPAYVKRSVTRGLESEILLKDRGSSVPDEEATDTTAEGSDPFADNGNEERPFDKDCGLEYSYEDDCKEDAVVAVGAFDVMPLVLAGMDNIQTKTPAVEKLHLSEYVKNLKKAAKENMNSPYRLTETERISILEMKAFRYEIDGVDQERERLIAERDELNEEQLHAYEVARSHISGEIDSQMIMFLSGEGGTGKSKVIQVLTSYTRCLYGKTEGVFGAVLKTAPTGGAAFNIQGHTWQSALCNYGFGRLKIGQQLDDKTANRLSQNLRGIQLFILDEISFVGLEDLYEISARLRVATGVMDRTLSQPKEKPR